MNQVRITVRRTIFSVFSKCEKILAMARGQSRRTIQQHEAVSQNAPCVDQPNSSRRTKFLLGDMDQSQLGDEGVTSKSRLIAVAVQNADEVARRSPFVPEVHVESKKQRETINFNTDMDQSRCPRKSPSLEPPFNKQKSRLTMIERESMDQTCITNGTIRQSSNHSENNIDYGNLAKSFSISQPTSCVVENMDVMLSPIRKIESIHLERSKVVESSLLKTRETVYQEAIMDETRYETPPQAVNENIVEEPLAVTGPVLKTIDLTLSPPKSIIRTLSNKSRQTVLTDRAMDQTIPLLEPMQQVNIALPTPAFDVTVPQPARHTIYDEDPMEETTVTMKEITKTTTQLYDRQSVVDVRCNIGTAPITTTAKALQTEANKPNRQTILILDDMEQTIGPTIDVSFIKCSSISPKGSHSSRRTIIQSDNIAEEAVKYEINLEQSESALPADSPTHIKQEQIDKSDFSFVVPQLPDDCVLRNATPGHFYRSNQTLKITPQLSQPQYTNESITEPSISTRKTFPMVADLSEIACTDELITPGTRPTGCAIPSGDISSIVLKEVTEPPIVTPAVPVSVIQETPKRTSMIPVRKSRGSIFVRQSMDLDESGITPIVSQEHCESESDHGPAMKSNDSRPPVPVDANVLVKNELVIESSDDEFFDAVLNSESIDEQDENIVRIAQEAMSRGNANGRGGLKFIEVNDVEQSYVAHDQTTVGCKTLMFTDVNDLEQTAASNQKRHLSHISKSVLLEQENDPLNVSLTNDYPMKKRRANIPTPAKHAKEVSLANAEQVCQETERKSMRRVTFCQDLLHSVEQEELDKRSESVGIQPPEVEAVTIKEECVAIVEDEGEHSKFGQTLLTDPSVFIIEESDMLVNESNISFVESPSSERIDRGSTLKFNSTYYQEYVNLTLYVDAAENMSYIVISDDSVTVPNSGDKQNLNSQPLEMRLTLEDLPDRINKTRESLVLNSTVASEAMYELRQQVSEKMKTCCSFQGNCNCRHRRTMAAVKRENVEMVREAWNQNFNRILESVTEVPIHDIPLNYRILEVFSRPMKPLPLPCLEKQQAHLPETPSIWFLCENFMKSLQIINAPKKVYNPCDLPATPRLTALIINKLDMEGYRWFLDTSDEFNKHLYLRHRILRSIRFKIQLQKSLRWYSKEEDVRIVRLECIENRNDLVCSARLLVAHLEFVRVMDKIAVQHLCSQHPTTDHLMSLIVHLDSIIEHIFSKVDKLYHIVRNNGAILEQHGNDDRLHIEKYFEYQHDGVVHWNRISVQFNAIDRIDHHSVVFHRNMINAECLYPTEHQYGRVGIQGLIFLECLLWNVEKISTR